MNIPLGNTTVYVSRLGVGAMTWGDPKGLARLQPAKIAYGGAHGPEEERQAVEVSLAAGMNLFDTAAMYSGGAAEQRLGELAAGRDIVIASKFPSSFSFRVEKFPEELEGSLKRLRRSSIDLYQHHFPNKSISIPHLMDQLADAVEAGNIKAVGVSNYSADQMRLAYMALKNRGIPLASNQVQYSLLHRQPETDGVLDACRELGVTLIAYSPLAMGALTGKYSGNVRPSGLRRLMPSFNKKSLDDLTPVIELLRQVGERYGKTPSQVALRWLIENPLVVAIPGAKNGQQAASNAEALSFSLNGDEIQAIDSATRKYRQ